MNPSDWHLPKGCPSDKAVKEFQEMFEAATGILLDPEEARREATAFLSLVHVVLHGQSAPEETISKN